MPPREFMDQPIGTVVNQTIPEKPKVQENNGQGGLVLNLIEPAKNIRLFIATPMYGGQCHGLYVKSILDLQAMCAQLKIQTRFSFLFNESLITRARNYMVDEFLRARTGATEEFPEGQEYTHMIFIDSDIEFNPEHVLHLLALDKDIVGGPYPKKTINWGNVARAFKKNIDTSPDELVEITGEYVFNPVPGTIKFSVYHPLDVLEVGTGYMLIKREVFNKYKEYYPNYSYKPDHVGQKHFDGSREIHCYFQAEIDPISKRYLSEDYLFCQNWRKMGGQVWLAPWITSTHLGTMGFKGNLIAVANLSGEM